MKLREPMIDEIEKELKKAVKEKRLEDFLLSFLDANPSPDSLEKLFSLLQKESLLPLPSFLFSLILDYLKEKGAYLSAIRILKSAACYTDETNGINLRKTAIGLLKLAYPIKDIDTYISYSHLDGDRDIKEGIEEVERFVLFAVGNYLFSQKLGLGKIREYNFLLDRVSIEFVGNVCSFPIPFVLKNFSPLSSEHYLVKKEIERENLKRLAEEDPVGLFTLLLKSFGRLKISEVKTHLSGVIRNWEDFWKKVKQEINSHPNIQITQGKEKQFIWSEEPIIKEQRATSKERCQTEFQEQRAERLSEEFFAVRDERRLNMIFKSLKKEEAETLLYDIFTAYRFYPFHFYWLAKYHKSAFPTKALFFRIFDLLSNNNFKDYWRYLKNLLKRKDFIEDSLKEMTKEEVTRIEHSLSFVPSLLEYEKDELKKVLEKFVPKEEEDVIYNTEEGIRRKEERLRQLILALKKNAEAMSRARSQGDLMENYEYKIAREERARLMNQIEKLKEDLKKATPINLTKKEFSEVEIGTRVRVRNLISKEEKEFTILGPWDIDLEKNIISYSSPLGNSLLGKKLGERIEILDGTYEIIAIADGRNPKNKSL